MRIGRWAAGATAVGYGVLQVLGRRAGSTAAERRASLPGDDLVPAPQLVTDHAITIDTAPDVVWPWLTQMGWHLGGFYTPDWIDRVLFPMNWPSLNHLDPNLVRALQVGDVIPDGPPGTAYYVVELVDAPRVLVLHSTTHLPRSWAARSRASIDWTWTFVLSPQDDSTRLHLRVRGRTDPWWLTLAYLATIVPVDFVMTRGMLRGIRWRAQAWVPARPSGRAPWPGRAAS